MCNALQLEGRPAYLVPPALCIYVRMWRNFLIPEVDLTAQSRLMKEQLGTVPGECLHTYSALKEKGGPGRGAGRPHRALHSGCHAC